MNRFGGDTCSAVADFAKQQNERAEKRFNFEKDQADKRLKIEEIKAQADLNASKAALMTSQAMAEQAKLTKMLIDSLNAQRTTPTGE